MDEPDGCGTIAEPLRPLAVSVGEIHEDPANVRIHDERNLTAIADSLATFGQRKPIVVRREGMVVVAGNGTLAAARRLGWAEIAAVVLDDDEMTAARYAIADNRTAELATWDDEGLARTLSALREDDALDAVGFGSEDLDELLYALRISANDDPTPPSGEELRNQRGIEAPSGTWKVLVGDVSDILPTFDAESFDAVFSDPPYGLSFMGKAWDHGVPSAKVWTHVLACLRPGAHLMTFGGSRTFHLLTVAIEDAGAEIRDVLCWLYGSGFPKSHDVSKALDDGTGHVVSVVERMNEASGIDDAGRSQRTPVRRVVRAPKTPEAQRFDGYGTALKPAWEPCVLARKPLLGTIADNVVEHGTGALNIAGARIGDEEWGNHPPGRWPANAMLDGEAAAMLDAQSGEVGGGNGQARLTFGLGGQGVLHGGGHGAMVDTYADSGGASRFFYVAKASRSQARANHHPTVKPIDLCRWLATLLLPPPLDRPRRILVPFSGSGSEMIGCLLAGWDEVVGVELSEDYADIARTRLASWQSETDDG